MCTKYIWIYLTRASSERVQYAIRDVLMIICIILLKFEKCHGMCLSGYSSAVYWSTGAKLGREIRDGHRNL